MRFIFTILFLVSFASVSLSGIGDVYFCEDIEKSSSKLAKYNMWWKTNRIEIVFHKRKDQDISMTYVLRILRQDKNSFIAHLDF